MQLQDAFFTRESVCMADDVLAPNIERIWISDELSEAAFSNMILKYLPKGNRRWRGYCDGLVLADVAGEDHAREVVLQTAWKERLLKFREVHFVHSKDFEPFRDTEEPPEQDLAAKEMDYAKAAKIFRGAPQMHG